MTIEKRTTHFRGRVISLTVDDVTLPNGHRAALEIVHHPGGAAIVALDDRASRVSAAAVPARRWRLAVGAARGQARAGRAAARTPRSASWSKKAGVDAATVGEPRNVRALARRAH